MRSKHSHWRGPEDETKNWMVSMRGCHGTESKPARTLPEHSLNRPMREQSGPALSQPACKISGYDC